MNQKIYAEIEQIRLNTGGFVRPVDMVEFARNEDTELHSHFTWDDGEAAEKYRLAEARSILRVCVQLNESTSENVRAFVSLTPDRHPAGGYRAMADVIGDEVLADVLLRDAVAEVSAFKRKIDKYRKLTALNHLIEAVDEIVEKHSPQSESKASA